MSPMEKIEALKYGYSLEELLEYQGLEGFALVEDLRTGIQKVYSYSFAKFLKDKGVVEILGVGNTPQELMDKSEERIRSNPSPSEKTIILLEKLEKLLKSTRPTEEQKREVKISKPITYQPQK